MKRPLIFLALCSTLLASCNHLFLKAQADDYVPTAGDPSSDTIVCKSTLEKNPTLKPIYLKLGKIDRNVRHLDAAKNVYEKEEAQ